MKRTLVTRNDSAGDALLAGPAIRAISAGGSRVTLLCGPRGEEAAKLLPGTEELLVWRAPWIDHGRFPVDRESVNWLVGEIAARRFDEAAILTSSFQDPLPMALLLRLAGVPRIAAVTDDFAGSLVDDRVPDPGEVHEVERNMAVVEALGHRPAEGDRGYLEVQVDASAPLPELPRSYVAVHPGASTGAREWPLGYYSELVQLLTAAGHSVVVTGGPDEKSLAREIAGGNPAVVELAGRTTLDQLARVLDGASALVAGNTGPAHLAAAVGTPVVSIFALTVSPARWRPWRVPSIVLSHEVECAGCRARECPVPGHPCVGEVKPGQVFAELELLVAPGQPAADRLPKVRQLTRQGALR